MFPPIGRLAVCFALASLALLLAVGSALASRLPGPDPIVAAAGDISCAQGPDGSTNCRDQATSDLLVNQGLSRVLGLGDQQYESGELSAFNSYYDLTWGRVKEISSPSPGNHDPFSSGYSAYFGSRAPNPYYSYDIGQWHLISLDSNNVNAAQLSWLRSDLAANATGKCVLAYWHHSRFSSGTTHGNSTRVLPFWTELYNANADLVLSGHEHNYERFVPQDPNGTADSARGIRQFVVGTGGKSHYGFGAPQPNSEVRSTGTFGVLELALRPGAYEWLFVPEVGMSFSDSGTGVCHSAADLSVNKSDSPDPAVAGETVTYDLTVRNDGPSGATGVSVIDYLPASVAYQSTTPSQGTCPEASGTVTCNLGAIASGGSATVQVVVTPQSEGTITNTGSVQANENDPSNSNNIASVDTTVVRNGYVHPKGATPTRFALVPTFERCESVNGTHGPPLVAPSCGPPMQSSQFVTVGTPDANGKPANSAGFLTLQVVGESPIDPTNGDQADLRITGQLTDVRTKNDLSDYTGELEGVLVLRITDRLNDPSETTPATVTDTPFRFTIGCAATTGTADVGGQCNVVTTADTLTPGIAREGKRSIWELSRLEIYDGGPDGVASTADNTLFAVQGVFAP